LSKQTACDKNIQRLIDANANRSKEGLRVLEDIMRFIVEDAALTAQLKRLRHRVTSLLQMIPETQAATTLPKRNIRGDVGKLTIVSELKRKGFGDIFFANAQRVKESIRVLEEFSKLYDKNTSASFKHIRYELYAVEKHALEKINKLCNNKQKRKSSGNRSV
jgi:thiamine-phosphate pyrophosphorylase